MKQHIVFIILLLTCRTNSQQSVLDWLFGANEDRRSEGQSTNVPKGYPVSGEMVAKIPFELKAADEKFLDEAQKYGNLELSELDACHHRLIMQLKSSCSSMSEEDISKLAVNLLNCQSYVEGRPIFPCSKHMSLQECTQSMDQNTWNAYHIVSSRARSICYSARQLQFKASAEITVNKLAITAREQLEALKNLQEGQEKLGGVTVAMLSSMTEGQHELMEQQISLKSSQMNINSQMSENMRMLVREKALIAAGQKELSSLTEEILKKLENAEKQLSAQEETRKQNHQELIKDLSQMVEVAKSFQKQVDESTKTLTQLQNEAATYFEATVDNLNRINSSISYLMALLNQIRGEVDQKLGWIASLADGTEQRLNVIYTCSLHLAFFLVAAICILFLQAPPATRVALFVCVLTNALWELQFSGSLGFIELTAAITFLVTTHWFILYLFKKKLYLMSSLKKAITNGEASRHKVEADKTNLPSTSRTQVNQESSYSSTLRQRLGNTSTHSAVADSSYVGGADGDDDDDLNSSENEDMFNLPDTTTNNSSRQFTLDGIKSHLDRTLGRLSRSSTPIESRSSTPIGSRSSTPRRSNLSRSSTPRSLNPKPICRGKTKNGAFCRLTCIGDTDYCRLHQAGF